MIYQVISRLASSIPEIAIILDNGDTMTNELLSQDKKEGIYRELLFGILEDLYLIQKRDILGR